MRKSFVYYVIVLGLVLAFAGLDVARAQSIPPQQDAGAVLQHHQREMWLRRNAPWMFGPITEQDVSPPDEPVIEWHDTDIQAEILPSGGEQLQPVQPGLTTP